MSLHEFANIIDSYIGNNAGSILLGVVVGLFNYVILDIPSSLIRFGIAILTAGVSGFIAVIGKNFGIWVWKKITKK